MLLPTLTYGLEIWAWNRAQQSRVHAVEMSYLRQACGVTRQKDESNESVYERCGMGTCAKCSVVQWVKINTLGWFGHMEKEMSKEFMKKVYIYE